MGFNKRYIDKERIASTFSRLGIYGVRDLLGLPNAYQEGRENDVAFDITDEVLKLK